MLKNLAIALQSLHKHVKIIRVRDIADITKPKFDMLNIDPGRESPGAKLVLVMYLNKPSIDDVGLLAAPVVRLEIVVEFLLVGP